MKKKAILIVTNPCISDPRVEFEAETIANLGLKVEILAWDRIGNSNAYEKKNNYYIRRIFIPSQFSMGIKQIFKILKFLKKAYQYIAAQEDCYIIHCNDLDTLPIGVLCKIFMGKKIVYDAHEIYCDMVFEKNKLFRYMCILLEKFLLRYVDIFFTVGEVRKRWYKGNKYSKVPIILGNWKQEFNISFDVDKEKNKLNIKDKIVILYIGSLNNERRLIDLIKAIQDDGRFFLYIGGDGAQKEKIIRLSNNISNVKYIGFIKDKKIMEYYNAISDVIYYGLNEDKLISKTAVPNKMFEAIAYNKVFYCTELGEMSEINKNRDLFIFIKDIKKDLETISIVLKNPYLRNIISDKNRLLYQTYNKENAKKILEDNYYLLIENLELNT